MKPLVLYHSHCTDGFGAAWSFWTKYRDTYEYLAVQYGDIPPDVTGRTVYLVDFSYRREIVEQMLQVANTIYFIDHHKTAIEDLKGLEDIHQNFMNHSDNTHSGAYLAWKFVHGDNEQLPRLIENIQDRDLWKFEVPWTLEITAFLYSVPFDFYQWDMYAYNWDYRDTMIIAGKALLSMQTNNIRSVLDLGVNRISLAGHNVPCVNCPKFMASDVGAALYQNEKFSVTYFDMPAKRTYSLRSNQDDPNSLDVGAIASSMGGGGHKHAAGFTTALPSIEESLEINHVQG